MLRGESEIELGAYAGDDGSEEEDGAQELQHLNYLIRLRRELPEPRSDNFLFGVPTTHTRGPEKASCGANETSSRQAPKFQAQKPKKMLLLCVCFPILKQTRPKRVEL